MCTIRSLWTRFLREKAGNVLPIATIGLLLGAVMIGSALDFGRDYKVRNQLQAACDSGVLAGRRTVTTAGYDAASQQAANDYFATNFDEASQEAHDTHFVTTSDDDGKTVRGTATTTLDTLIMRVFDRDQFNIEVTCASSMGVGNADVMMVLDTTGSMTTALGTSTRIDTLRDAMLNFYHTLQTATADTNARIRYGFVPYSTTVNVGRLLYNLDPSYIADAHDYQTRVASFTPTQSGYQTTAASQTVSVTYSNPVASTWTKGNTAYNNNTLCTNAKPADQTAYSNYGSSSNGAATTSYAGTQKLVTQVNSQPQRQYAYQCSQSGTKYYIYTMYYSQTKYTTTVSYYDAKYVDTFDSWTYSKQSLSTDVFKKFTPVVMKVGTKGANVTSTWGGCIHERRTTPASTFSYNSILEKITPTSALDVDLDAKPTSNDDETKWAPLWPEVTFRRFTDATLSTRTTSDSPYGPSSPAAAYCPAAAQTLTEMDEDAFTNYANKLVATGNTYLDIGMIWGGRMISPQGIFQDNVNDPPANGGEVSRHVIFMTDGFMEPNIDTNQAWGIEWYDRKVTDDGSSSDAARHTQRFLAVCQAIKDKGVRVWVIAFTASLSNDLKTCASDNSSYVAKNANELNTAFQEIAKQVGELRVVR